MSDELEQKNKKTVRNLLLLVALMFLFAMSLIPLYDVLCEITGINGKSKQALSAPNYNIDSQRQLTLEFITTVSAGTGLEFKADEHELKVHPGELISMTYTVTNKTDTRMFARANPSFTPGFAAGYVKNTECFCFAEQQLAPGETQQLTVKLLIDPALPDTYKRLTFGLTFFNTSNNRG